MKKIFVYLIEKYQKNISPMFGKNCKYYPTCSEYTKQAIIKYGAIRGLFIRCKKNYKMQSIFKRWL